MAQDWKQVVENAREELAKLEIQREGIEQRIAQLKRIILATSPLVSQDSGIFGMSDSLIIDFQASGITNSCRDVLRLANRPLTPLEVRDALARNGLDLTNQKNAMASIHTVLKRLKEQGDVKVTTPSDGGTAYQWIRRFPRLRRHHQQAVLKGAMSALAGKESEDK